MNDLVVSIAILLFPGIISAAIADKITLHSPRWGSFKYSIYSFIFGVSCYSILGIGSWLLSNFEWFKATVPSLTHPLNVWTITSPSEIHVELSEVIGATVVSPFIAFFAAFTVNFKLFNKLASLLRVSRKFGDENLFSFYLNSDDLTWVYVRDANSNLTYEGRVVSYSENEHMQELVLSDVKVYRYEDSEELYSVPTVYLSKPNGTFRVEQVPEKFLEEDDG